MVALGAPRDAGDGIGVTFECGHLLTGSGVPDDDGLVMRSRSQLAALGAPRDAVDNILVLFESRELLTRRGVPDDDSAVIRP